ncbi:MAG: c-type cytochrome [Anaerolineae bacterium]|nr:c-type cytochrome [Anaerolineae bacterium]
MSDAKLPIPIIIAWLGLALLLVLVASGCQQVAGAADQPFMPGGNAERGAELIPVYGCGTCHTIPGIRGADALVGPPLTGWAARAYIAGAIPNTPQNLLLWLQDPQSVEPGTAMPDMGLTEQAARDIGAYLYTLTRDD